MDFAQGPTDMYLRFDPFFAELYPELLANYVGMVNFQFEGCGNGGYYLDEEGNEVFVDDDETGSGSVVVVPSTGILLETVPLELPCEETRPVLMGWAGCEGKGGEREETDVKGGVDIAGMSSAASPQEATSTSEVADPSMTGGGKRGKTKAETVGPRARTRSPRRTGNGWQGKGKTANSTQNRRKVKKESDEEFTTQNKIYTL